jgi:hypothetical protein
MACLDTFGARMLSRAFYFVAMAPMTSVNLKFSGTVDAEIGTVLAHATDFLGRLTDSAGISGGPDRRFVDIWGQGI